MRAVLCVAWLAFATTSLYGQRQQQPGPAQSGPCSIPLLRMPVSPSIGTGFVKRPPPVEDPMPLVKTPAPPCGEGSGSQSRTVLLDQRRQEQVRRLQELWKARQKPEAKPEEGTPQQ